MIKNLITKVEDFGNSNKLLGSITFCIMVWFGMVGIGLIDLIQGTFNFRAYFASIGIAGLIQAIICMAEWFPWLIKEYKNYKQSR